jgi:transposase
MNNPFYFLGIDIGKDSFTASLYHAPTHTHQVFTGSMRSASRTILKWLAKQGVDATQTILALEATGVYGERLCYELAAKEYQLSVLHPTDVRRSMRHPERNSDTDDSRQMAELISERYRKLTLWQPNLEVVDRIKTLLAERRQIVTMTVQTKNALQTTNALQAAKFKRHRVAELEARDQGSPRPGTAGLSHGTANGHRRADRYALRQ